MWLLLAFIAIPLIEITLFIEVGGMIGLPMTLLIVLVTAILGTTLVRSQGVKVLGDLQRSLSELRDPTEPLAHGAMILFAGALLLTPGFFTDAVGLALMIPNFRVATFKFLRKRVNVTTTFSMGGAGPGTSDRHDPRANHPSSAQQGDVIDGEFTEVDPSKRPTHRPSGWTKH
ncbi:FxsA family protein [Rhodalgimonas zhirmunskyi]|uniref:FxsA family protein n=1 Tax=Rhodalgimonas zhirmunskyi TaxID=2964767 RepID=A0AAJ1UDB8_9RHOB|nr:FxsA family protein [Rhodoalgimonas zhirmunskyi]MDQ2094316.1 FxsA family protein [Rhodoalgimonas zhirmunskyi]